MGLGWILGIFGIGGVAGLGALAFFAPTMFASVLSAFKTGVEFALDMLSGWPLKAYLICAALVAASFYFSGQRGWDNGVAWQRHQDQAIAKSAVVIGHRFAASLHAGEIKIVENLTLQQGQITVRFARIKKEISRYVSPQMDKHYLLPVGLVRLHDAAILNLDPSQIACAACGPDNAPAPTTASAFSANEIAWGKAYWHLRTYAKAVLADDLLVRREYAKYRKRIASLNTAVKE